MGGDFVLKSGEADDGEGLARGVSGAEGGLLGFGAEEGSVVSVEGGWVGLVVLVFVVVAGVIDRVQYAIVFFFVVSNVVAFVVDLIVGDIIAHLIQKLRKGIERRVVLPSSLLEGQLKLQAVLGVDGVLVGSAVVDFHVFGEVSRRGRWVLDGVTRSVKGGGGGVTAAAILIVGEDGIAISSRGGGRQARVGGFGGGGGCDSGARGEEGEHFCCGCGVGGGGGRGHGRRSQRNVVVAVVSVVSRVVAVII